MKKAILISFLFLFFSCNHLIEKPENLLSKDEMSEILMDIAISEQSSSFKSDINMEVETRYILKKHNVSATVFKESYKYYTLNKDLPSIIEKAQKKMIDKFPDLEHKLENTKAPKVDLIEIENIKPPRSLNDSEITPEEIYGFPVIEKDSTKTNK